MYEDINLSAPERQHLFVRKWNKTIDFIISLVFMQQILKF